MMKKSILIALSLFAATMAQCGSYQACGQACYDPTVYSCATDYTGTLQLCPIASPQVCNKGCFNPSSYHCVNGTLTGGAAPATPATPVKLSTKSTTSTTSAAKSTTSATPVKASTTSSTTRSTTSSTTKATTAAVAATSAAAVNCAAMFAGLTCRTVSEDPTKIDAGSVASSRSWLCSSYSDLCQNIQPGGNISSCNSVEQLSYAMNLYYAKFSSQGASACFFGGIAALVSSATPTTSATPATPVATASPVVAPTPSPNNFPTQTADLRIINSCKTQLWFEARYGGAGAPLPGQTNTSTQALPGSYVDYVIPDTGLSGTRFWAKYGCDNNGKNCAIGDQMQYFPNPPGGCPPGGCTPPVDSLFEATWGCRPGSSCNSQNPTTWFDTSQVDGWTIPYKLTPVGDVSGCDCVGSTCGFKGVDASTLDLAKCPSGEDLSAGGNYTSVVTNGLTVALKSVDLRIKSNGQILGCMSPCKRLNWGYPYGLQQDESSGATEWMCCPTPTPNSCLPSQGCITPTACRAGPIVNTQYVAAVHSMAPGVYSYSYDDGVGLHACPAGVTKYTMEFCPAGSAAYPGVAT